MVEVAATAGFGGISLDGDTPDLSPAAFSFRASGALVCQAQAHGIEWQCISCGTLMSTTESQEEELRRRICIAHALACPLVSFQTLVGNPDTDPLDAYHAMVATIQDAVEFAQDLDVCLAVETARTSLVRTMQHAIDFVDDVDRRNLGIVYNPVEVAAAGGEEPHTAVGMARDYLLCTRLCGTDLLAIRRHEFDDVMRELRAAKFSEYCADCSRVHPEDSPPYIREQLAANQRHLHFLATLP
jgi:sugar phosphate isomerase/epimerase